MLTLALAFSVDAQGTKSGDNLSAKIHKMDDRTVSGEVVDESGEPLAGATVMLKGTDIGVATNIDGQFSIMVSGKKPVLEISYIGMKTESIAIEKTSVLFISLKRADNMMDEVVVTGYQNIKRENATGSYQIIRAEDMDKRYTGDITSNLEGRVPGVVYDPKSNSKDENAITIRGKSTFNAKESPLVVVDGFPSKGA